MAKLKERGKHLLQLVEKHKREGMRVDGVKLVQCINSEVASELGDTKEFKTRSLRQQKAE